MGIKRRDLPKRIQDQIGALPYDNPAGRPSKYHNVRSYSDLIGRNFHSNGERRMAEILYVRQEAGELSKLRFQVRVKLLGCVVLIVDFAYVEDGQPIHHEFKGLKTDTWRLQRKLWGLVGPTVYRVSYKPTWPATELITPKPSDELIEYVLDYLRRTKEQRP